MTRKLLKLALVALMTGFISVSAFAQIATPPVIDGDGSDAAWAGVTAMDLLRQNEYSGVTSADDFSATIKAMWDADNVYILLEEKDDVYDVVSNEDWNRDHYSVYFDFGNLKTAPKSGTDSYVIDADDVKDSVQFMLEKKWGIPGNLAFSNRVRALDSSLIRDLHFVEVIDTGMTYTLEMVIPLDILGVVLQAGDLVGFDAKVGDNDTEGGLDGKLSLYQKLDEGWRNPSYLGTVKVEDDGSFSKVMVTPVIDGVADYTWYEAATYPLEVKNEYAGVTGAADFSATIKTMWDADNVYILLEEKDDVYDVVSNEDWNRDHYSVYFDFGNLKTAPPAGQTDSYVIDNDDVKDSVQFMLEKKWGVAGNLAFANRVRALDSSLIRDLHFVEVIDTGKAYTLEMVIPLDIIGVDLQAGDMIGFDAKVGDNDTEGSLDGKLSWHQSMDEGWRNPSYLGNLNIEPGILDVDLGTTSAAGPQIVIDGVKDGAWSQAVEMKLLRQNEYSGVTSDADFSGSIRALWDADNVYLLLEEKDDVYDVVSNEDWNRDHYSVYFDFGNLKTAPPAGQTDSYVIDNDDVKDSVQFMLEKKWGVPGDLAFANRVRALDSSLIRDVHFVEVIDTGISYTLEVVIPLDILGVELKEGMLIGFDTKIGDNDTEGGLDGKLSWNQFLDEGWRNPSFLGTVELMGNGTFMGTPETPIEDVTFNVDMNGMIDGGIFDPSEDKVDLAGSMNNWGDPVVEAADTDGDGIYTYVLVDQEVGTSFEFKFRVNGTWDPISEFPGGGPNRTYTVVEGDNTVDVVFNDGDYTPWITEGVDGNKASYLQMYPNPATSMFTLSSAAEIKSVSISNVTGQLVYSAAVNDFKADVNISTLEAGMYIVSVKFESMEVSNRVLIKK